VRDSAHVLSPSRSTPKPVRHRLAPWPCGPVLPGRRCRPVLGLRAAEATVGRVGSPSSVPFGSDRTVGSTGRSRALGLRPDVCNRPVRAWTGALSPVRTAAVPVASPNSESASVDGGEHTNAVSTSSVSGLHAVPFGQGRYPVLPPEFSTSIRSPKRPSEWSAVLFGRLSRPASIGTGRSLGLPRVSPTPERRSLVLFGRASPVPRARYWTGSVLRSALSSSSSYERLGVCTTLGPSRCGSPLTCCHRPARPR
jgi:hypothetical protein